MKIYLSTPTDTAAEAASHGAVSLMAYRVGRSFHLYRTALPPARAELMDVDCSGFTGYGPHNALVSELMRECGYHGYTGIVMDLNRPTQQLTAFAAALLTASSRRGIELYLPEWYGRISEEVRVLLPAQNLSGTYSERLHTLAELYGAKRIALELECVHTDFSLPVRAGRGSVLSDGNFAALGRERTFYSKELEVNYMSYIIDGRAHLVLWDGLDSIRAKLATAEELGIGAAFMYYPHVRNIIDRIT